jgi:hypothetical protein
MKTITEKYLLNDIEKTALELRSQGKKYSEIGQILNISKVRAYQRVKCAQNKLKREPTNFDGLSVRAINCIKSNKIPMDINSIIKSIESKKLDPQKTKNYGIVTHQEICTWLYDKR